MTERVCAWCGASLPDRCNKNRTLCSNRCKRAVYNERHRDEVNRRQAAKNKTDHTKAIQKKHRLSWKGAQTRVAYERRRAAERALALLILPSTQPPET